MRLPAQIAALAAFFLAMAPPALAQEAEPEPPRVQAIRVEGNRRVEADAVKASIATKPGEPLDRHKLDADLRALMKLGYFSDVVVEAEGPEESPTLVFRVAERPTVREVKYEGAKELSKDDLKAAVDLKVGAILDDAALRKNARKIQEKYVEKGYFLAEVTHRVEPVPDNTNQVVVVFAVNEHAKVQVKRVTFLGNGAVSREDLLAVMQTKEGGLLSFITQGGTYREEVFQHDLQALQALYLDRGYINIKVGKPSISLSSDRRFLYLTVPIEEGEQYRIGSIAFSGDLMGEEPRLKALVHTSTGEVFARSKVGRDLFAVADVYRDKGYANANVNPVTDVHPDTRTLDLTFDVQPGAKVYFERIEIVGNTKTRDKVIRRELRVYEGELFDGSALRQSKQRITALGYFETVDITTQRGSSEDKLVARVEVKERATGTFQVGAGFSSYENFILTGQISQNNFFGWGQTLSLQIQWSRIRQLFQVQFVEPYFLDTKWTFAFDLYRTEGIYSTFTRAATGGSITWGYELSGLAPWWSFASKLEDMRLFATYTNEYVNVRPSVVEDIVLFNRFRSGTTSAVRLSLQWDKRDNRLFPTRGFYESVSAEVAPPFLAPSALFGDAVNLFTRYTLDSRFYHPVIWGVVARAKVTVGYIGNWDADHPVPVSELYYLGGINSIRGYRLLDIAPRVKAGSQSQPDAVLSDLPVGGNKQLILNVELEFPLFEKVGIRGVVFADAGNAFAPGTFSDPAVPYSLYKSWGFGFRWFSPIGPLRFEWGIPLNRRKDELSGQFRDNAIDFQFTIGSFF